MNFEFSEEQLSFGVQVRRALERLSPMAEVRRALDGHIAYSEPAWRGLAELGFTAIPIPERFGGLGLGALECCVAAEEIGRSLAPVPSLSSTYLCSVALSLYGSSAQQDRWLPELAAGRVVGTWAAAEGATPLAPAALATICRDGRLTGRKTSVLDAGLATLAVVLAKDAASAPALFVVELAQDAVRRTAQSGLDPTRPLFELRFDGALAQPLGDTGRAGGAEWERLQQIAAVYLAFEQIGAADRALQMSCDYALQRRSFGRQIGSYQAIKHKLAEVYARNQIARSHAYFGAWAVATDAPVLPLAAAAARVSAIEALGFAAQENIQVHGGMGYTWELDAHLFYRRARLWASILGSRTQWRARLMRELERLGPEAALPGVPDGL